MIVLTEVDEGSVVLGEITASSANSTIVVGVPAYNEEKTIAPVILEAQKYADTVVVCDDGSTDLTAQIAERLGAEVVEHRRNLGYGAAIQSLFSRARELNADVLVTLDADGQHMPREVPRIVEPILSNIADVVIGSRMIGGRSTRTMPWHRRAGVKIITKLVNNTTKHGIKDSQSGFRAYSRKSLDALTIHENGMGVSTEILMNAKKHGLRICEVSSRCNYHGTLAQTSTYNPVRHGLAVVSSIIKLVVEEKPLRALGIPGTLFLVVGIAFGAWMLQIYAVAHHVVTNIALAALAFTMLGFFSISTAITLYAIKRLAERTNAKNTVP